MGWVKNGLLLTAGGLVGMFLGGVLYDTVFDRHDYSDDDDRPEPDGLELLVKQIRREAEAAMAECVDDEEREAVYAQVAETVEKVKTKLQKRGEVIIEELKQQAKERMEAEEKEQETADASGPVQSFKEKLNKISESLDEAVESIKPDLDGGPIPAI